MSNNSWVTWYVNGIFHWGYSYDVIQLISPSQRKQNQQEIV